MGDTYPTQELLDMRKELEDYFTSKLVQAGSNEMQMVDKLDFLSATEKNGLLGKFSALNSVFNPAGAQPERASFVAQCKVCISGMIVFVGEKIPADARDRSAIEFIQFLIKFWLALDASAGAAAPAPPAEAAEATAPAAAQPVGSNVDMWRCIHRLASVLEEVQFGPKFPVKKGNEQDVMMLFARNNIIAPALIEFVRAHNKKNRLSYGMYDVEYQLVDGHPLPEDLIDVIYDYDARAISGKILRGPILFTIGTGLINDDESSSFLHTCKEKLTEFMRAAQQHFDANGTMEGFERIATLR